MYNMFYTTHKPDQLHIQYSLSGIGRLGLGQMWFKPGVTLFLLIKFVYFSGMGWKKWVGGSAYESTRILLKPQNYICRLKQEAFTVSIGTFVIQFYKTKSLLLEIKISSYWSECCQ